jgi:hypothetical protein
VSAGLRALALGLLAALVYAAPIAEASYEVNVSKDQRARDGEPSLGVNPTDSSNLVMAYMKANQGECAVSASFDRGRTWRSQVLREITDPFYSYCADPTLTFGADGTVYVAAIAFHQSFQLGHVLVTRSADGGRHWTRPVEAVGGSTPPIDGFDRPWLAFDKATRTLYLTTMTIFSRPALPIAHRYLLASRDKGRHWGRAHIVDSGRYPADHWATGTIAVGPRGRVAIAYSARGVPESGARCPCAVLATTRDGVNFSHSTVPLGRTLFGISLPEPGQLSALALSPGPAVAADPTQAGRYTVVVADWAGLAPFTLGEVGLGPEVRIQAQLFRTDDSGRSWAGPVLLGENPGKDRERLWVAYAPSGTLGAIWRTHHTSCCFDSTDVWAVVSRNGGRSFVRPRRLSHASSPFTGLLGDDYQSVVLDRSFLHTAWGDGRSGNVEAYYARLRHHKP